MLIRSQKRDAIVHIKSFNCIVIKRLSRDIPCRCSIDAEYDDGTAELGKYESLERAKEILEEITEFYTTLKVIELGGFVLFEERQKFGDMKIGCYDMPAE